MIATILLIIFPILKITSRYLDHIGIYRALYKTYLWFNTIVIFGMIMYYIGLSFWEIEYLIEQSDTYNLMMILLVDIWMIHMLWNHLKELMYGKFHYGPIRKYLFFALLWVILNGLMVYENETHYYKNHQIEKAYHILESKWENQTSFEEISKIWFLKSSLLVKYPNHKELFKKIYDTPIETQIKKKLSSNDLTSRDSFQTSSLSKWENAQVHLNYVEYNNEFLQEIQTIQTTVKYQFQNTSQALQEVIFDIELPNSNSLVTSLSLWLNQELTGIIAPRWASEQVYRESMRKTTPIDPAFLEQLGPKTYRLRVFPVPSSLHATQGRQEVQFTYLTSYTPDQKIILSPKMHPTNLKIDEKSQINIKFLEGNTLLFQESVLKNKEKFFEENTYYTKDLLTQQPPICRMSAENQDIVTNKNIVFFDISKSVKNQKNIKNTYKKLLKEWKKKQVNLEIYTYNFEVYPSDYELSNLKFWWYSDTSKVIDFIGKSQIQHANIVIISDDDSFEYTTVENKNIDYSTLSKNKISFIQVGDAIKSLKNEVSKALLASSGWYYNYPQDAQSIHSLYSHDDQNCIVPVWYIDIIQKFDWYHKGNKVLWEIIGEKNWLRAGDDMFEYAKKWNFVNMYASLIALETEQQEIDLANYSQRDTRYDTHYDNKEIPSAWSTTRVPERGLNDFAFGAQWVSINDYNYNRLTIIERELERDEYYIRDYSIPGWIVLIVFITLRLFLYVSLLPKYLQEIFTKKDL